MLSSYLVALVPAVTLFGLVGFIVYLVIRSAVRDGIVRGFVRLDEIRAVAERQRQRERSR